jgi:hypothetical protein
MLGVKLMTYRVEYLNDHGDWIKKSWHRNKEHAVIVAQVCEQSGKKARIIHEGKIIYEK